MSSNPGPVGGGPGLDYYLLSRSLHSWSNTAQGEAKQRLQKKNEDLKRTSRERSLSPSVSSADSSGAGVGGSRMLGSRLFLPCDWMLAGMRLLRTWYLVDKVCDFKLPRRPHPELPPLSPMIRILLLQVPSVLRAVNHWLAKVLHARVTRSIATGELHKERSFHMLSRRYDTNWHIGSSA